MASCLLHILAVCLIAPALAGRREGHKSGSRGSKFNISSTVQVIDASQLGDVLSEAAGPSPGLHRKRIVKKKGDLAGEDLKEVSVLTISYNFGEACWPKQHRKDFERELKELVAKTKPSPMFIVLASQEVYAEEGNDLPLLGALEHEGIMTYVWLGASSIEGRTKLKLNGECKLVRTAVEVAVYYRHQQQVNSVSGHWCTTATKAECRVDQKTHKHFEGMRFKRTKGFVWVWIQFGGSFTFRFISVHLDTKKFEANLKEIREDVVKKGEERGPIFNVIAGDYNTRLTQEGALLLCSTTDHDLPLKDRLRDTLNINGIPMKSEDVARLGRIKALLHPESMGEAMAIQLVTPAQIAYQGVAGVEQEMYMPTYKYPEKEQVTEAAVADNPEAVFGVNGTSICVEKDKGKWKLSLGLLDHITALFATNTYTAGGFDTAAKAKHIIGSDHVIVSHVLSASVAAKAIRVVEGAHGVSKGDQTVEWDTGKQGDESASGSDSEDVSRPPKAKPDRNSIVGADPASEGGESESFAVAVGGDFSDDSDSDED